MALNPTGAKYRNQDAVQKKDRVLGEAIDDVASQVEQIRQQGNFGPTGPPAAPHPLTKITVTAASGFASIQLTHNNAPAGTRYVVEMSSTPNFLPGTVQTHDIGISLAPPPIYLKGLTRYFRAAPKFLSSNLASWIYFGGPTSPTAIAF